MEFDSAIDEGSCFTDYEAFCHSLKNYEEENNVKFAKVDSQTVENANRFIMCPENQYNPRLVYAYVKYRCKLANQQSRTRDTEKHRRGRQPRERTDCPAGFCLSADRSSGVLRITSAHLKHNHGLEAYSTVTKYSGFEDYVADGHGVPYSNLTDSIKDVKEESAYAEFVPSLTETSLLTDSTIINGQAYGQNHADHMMSCLQHFRQHGLYCDTALLSRDRVIFVHGMVLGAVCSNIFTALNKRPFLNSQPNIINVTMFESIAVEAFVDFIYTGQADLAKTADIRLLCDYFGVIKESVICEDVPSGEPVKIDFAVSRLLTNDNAESGNNHEAALDAIREILGSAPEHQDMIDCLDAERKGPAVASVLQIDETVSVSNSDDRFVCNICGATFDSLQLHSTHVVEHSRTEDGSFQCSFCSIVFKRKSALVQHQKVHGVKMLKTFECEYCLHTFSTKSAFIAHQAKHNQQNGGPKPFGCKSCGMQFSSEQQRTAHTCGTGGTPQFMRIGMKYKCLLCEQIFRRRTHVQDHINTHTGEKPYVCNICGLAFTNREYLHKHQVLHTDNYRFLCQKCGKRFRIHRSYALHQRTHTNYKPYVCNHCGVGFTQASALKGHQRIHTGERPYACDKCPQTFRLAMILRRHVMLAHMSPADYPFECSTCGKRFIANNLLQYHEKTHSKPHTCPRCNHRFAEPHRLKVHMKRCRLNTASS